MKKKGVAWQFLVLGIIAVLVMVFVLGAFKVLFGKEVDTTKGQIDETSTDNDCDGVMNIFDRCCTEDPTNREKVDISGCAPGDKKPSKCDKKIC